MADVAGYVGRRCLFPNKNHYTRVSNGGVYECKVLELSPSGRWVKLMDMNGRRFWKPAHEMDVLEALGPVPKPKKAPEAIPDSVLDHMQQYWDEVAQAILDKEIPKPEAGE